MSHAKPKEGRAEKDGGQGGQESKGKEQGSQHARACSEQPAETKAEKKGRPRPCGTGTFRRLRNQLQKRPVKRPTSSDLAQHSPAPEVGQGPE